MQLSDSFLFLKHNLDNCQVGILNKGDYLNQQFVQKHFTSSIAEPTWKINVLNIVEME
jgi:hypothetical protein